MEISFENISFIEKSTLEYVVTEALRQIFVNFDRSQPIFFQLINGSPYDPNIPGVPIPTMFGHIKELQEGNKWNEFKTIVRYYAFEFYVQVLAFANLPQFQDFSFTYRYYPLSGGGLVFVLQREKRNYVI